MEILGIGPLEFLLIVLLALIILGPREIQKAGKSIGKNLNKLVKSDLWREIRQTSDMVRSLPTELMRDANLESIQNTLKSPMEEIRKIELPTKLEVGDPADTKLPVENIAPVASPHDSNVDKSSG